MNDDERFKLRFGPYATPLFKYGDVVYYEIRGDVTIVEMSGGRFRGRLASVAE